MPSSTVFNADDRDHRHHLLLDDERVFRIGHRVEQLVVGGDFGAGMAGQHGGVDAHERAIEHGVGAAAGVGFM